MTTERDVVESCVCHKVRMAARAVTRAYDAHSARWACGPSGLRSWSRWQSRALSPLRRSRRSMGMDRSTLTRNVRPLAKDGLLAGGPRRLAPQPDGRDYRAGTRPGARGAATVGTGPSAAPAPAGCAAMDQCPPEPGGAGSDGVRGAWEEGACHPRRPRPREQEVHMR